MRLRTSTTPQHLDGDLAAVLEVVGEVHRGHGRGIHEVLPLSLEIADRAQLGAHAVELRAARGSGSIRSFR
jgi:hypothetical protein